MTHFLHGQRDCQTARELQYRIEHVKTEGEKKKLRAVLEAHRKSCQICKGV